MKIVTTDTELRALELASDKRSEEVRVPRQALRRLIADHYELLARARKGGTVIEVGTDQRSLA